MIFIVKPPYLAPQSFRPYIVNGSLRARKFVMTFFNRLMVQIYPCKKRIIAFEIGITDRFIT
ncbi:hypothetical protein DX323_05580 [Salmonella enterica]|nr:hypothetical protein [Salmonella enterica]EBM5130434.1 hypothetical protein [Salmonella enterica]